MISSSKLPTPPISRWHFVAAIQALEAATIILASLIALGVAQHHAPLMAPDVMLCLLAALLLAAIVHCVFRSVRAYDFGLLLRPGASAVLGAVALCIATGPLVVLSLLHDPRGEYARAWVLAWFVGGLVLMPQLRLAYAAIGRRWRRAGLIGHSVCVVGGGEEADACIEQARADESGIVVVGLFSDVPEHGGRKPAHAAPRVGTLADIPAFLQHNRVDEIILAVGPHERRRLRSIIQQLHCLPVKVLIFVEIACPVRQSAFPPRIGGMLLLPILGKPLDGWLWVLKDTQDRLLALMALIVFLPVMLVIALAIRVSSPGPILFRQVRQGYGGREFHIYKFRTMHVGAAAPTGSIALTKRDDPRVFPVGAFLRKSSLDELPQLLNVLRGDMWLIGPRPHSPLASAEDRLYVEAVANYASRHRIKPGITGWAQVNGWRGPTETVEQIEQRVEHDLYYIENWSMLLDARILCGTFLHGFIHRNAF